MVPALLIYGAQDKFVTLEEEQWMQEVCEIFIVIIIIGMSFYLCQMLLLGIGVIVKYSWYCSQTVSLVYYYQERLTGFDCNLL